MHKKKAFTLIELLVVIAIIALLLSVIMPSLKRAKESAMRIICMNNLKQIELAWFLYAEDNDSVLCSPPNLLNPDPLYEWIKIPVFPLITEQEYRLAMTEGVLWPYSDSEDVYKCPTGEKNELITYAIFPSMGWKSRDLYTSQTRYGTPFQKLNEIKSPSSRFVFTDEGKLSPDFFLIFYAIEAWCDQPLVRHNEGQTFVFADGHAEHWKWMDERTKEICRIDPLLYSFYVESPDNPDLEKMRRATWGDIPQ